jgi:TolB protein
LAAILIGIGLAMVQSRRLFARFNKLEQWAPAISVASAVVVLGLGLALTAGAVRGMGLGDGGEETAVSSSLNASPQTKPRAAPFSLENGRVLYQVLDEQGQYQLHAIPAAGGDARPLTGAPYGIWDYALSPHGETIVYSVLRADRGSDLWAMTPDGAAARQVLACPDAACRNPSWAPDGERLVYEKLDLSDPAAAGVTTLWWLDLASGETAPVFQDTQLPGFSPAWSPDGQWLSYIAPGMPTRIQLYNLADGRRHDFVTKTSMAVIWHPQGEAILLTDVVAAQPTPGQPTRTHLLRFDAATATLADLSGGDEVSDSWPAWSPDGARIAFVRRDFSEGTDTRGNQIWVMDGDGTNGRPLTAAADTLFQHLSWSPDGRYLLFHQYSLNEPLAKPAVKLIDVESGEIRPLAQPGSQPAWGQ